MAGLTTRKTTTTRSASWHTPTPSQPARKPAKRSTSATKITKKTVAKKAVSKKATEVKASVYAPKIQTLLGTIEGYVAQRRKAKGPQDLVAKRLHAISTQLESHLSKANAINPDFAKNLVKVNPSLRGIANVPQTLRSGPQKLSKYLREHVRKNVMNFLNNAKRSLAPIHSELKKLETQFNRQVKAGKGKKIQFRVDPSISKKFAQINSNITRFRNTWGKHLSTLALHGNAQMKTSVRAIKKQMDEIQKLIQRNVTIMNRYTKAAARKAGYRVQQLANNNHVKAVETRFNNIHNELESAKAQVLHYFDQLKAIKLF